MFREMRRKKQCLSVEECETVLHRGTSGVLAVSGDGGYPYAVPLSYVYCDGKILFHVAKSGHKLDAIQREPKVSFCVIDQDEVIPEQYTSYYRSVIVFGRMRVLETETEKQAALEKLALKYAPDDTPQGRQAAIDKDYARVCLLELQIEHMSGKTAKELVKAGSQDKK